MAAADPFRAASSFMQLLETIGARRQESQQGPVLTNNQYAYQRQRSAELLLADLDSFAQATSSQGRAIYMLGLEIEGVSDSADLLGLMPPLAENQGLSFSPIYRHLAYGKIFSGTTDGAERTAS